MPNELNWSIDETKLSLKELDQAENMNKVSKLTSLRTAYRISFRSMPPILIDPDSTMIKYWSSRAARRKNRRKKKTVRFCLSYSSIQKHSLVTPGATHSHFFRFLKRQLKLITKAALRCSATGHCREWQSFWLGERASGRNQPSCWDSAVLLSKFKIHMYAFGEGGTK